MGSEVSPLQSVQDNIKDRIKAEFANLIPDEMWAAMVKSVVLDFTTDPPKDRHSHGHTAAGVSPMKAMIRDEIVTIAKAHLKSEIDKIGHLTWDGMGERMASEAIRKLIADNFQEILQSVQSGFVEMAVQQAVQHIRNSMQRY